MLELQEKTNQPDQDITSIIANDKIAPANGLREGAFYKGGKVGTPYGWPGAALSRYQMGDVNFEPGTGGSLRIPAPSGEAQEVLRMLSRGEDPFAEFKKPAPR
jgi:hypothetical protein